MGGYYTSAGRQVDGALTDAACCDPARVVSCEQKIHEDFSLRISEEEKRLVAWGEGLIRGGMGSSGWLLGLFLGFTFLGTGGWNWIFSRFS